MNDVIDGTAASRQAETRAQPVPVLIPDDCEMVTMTATVTGDCSREGHQHEKIMVIISSRVELR